MPCTVCGRSETIELNTAARQTKGFPKGSVRVKESFIRIWISKSIVVVLNHKMLLSGHSRFHVILESKSSRSVWFSGHIINHLGLAQAILKASCYTLFRSIQLIRVDLSKQSQTLEFSSSFWDLLTSGHNRIWEISWNMFWSVTATTTSIEWTKLCSFPDQIA